MTRGDIKCIMSAIEGNSDFIAKPTEAQGFLVAALGMLEGAIPLGKLEPVPTFALTLLCGHACEAALKAILAKSGITAKILRKKPYGHDILNLWMNAHAVTTLKSPQPDWVSHLARVYDTPYSLRYPLKFHGIVLPNQQEMIDGTHHLYMLADSFVNA